MSNHMCKGSAGDLNREGYNAWQNYETFSTCSSSVAAYVNIYIYLYIYVYVYICIYVCIYIYREREREGERERERERESKTFDVLPGGLKVSNVPFISFATDDIKISWHNTTKSTEQDLLETLILGIEDKRIWMEEKFWDELRDILEDSEAEDLVDWFLKVLNYLDKQKKSDSKRKRKKLTKRFRDNPESVLNAAEYFDDVFNDLRF